MPEQNVGELLKAEKSALVLIARAEQCSWKLKCKLEKKKYSGETIQAVLDRLTELDLVNDRRYAELWLKNRISKGDKGPRILSELLRARGIIQETVTEALAASLTPEAEAELLRRCLARALKKKSLAGKCVENFPGKNSTEQKTAIRCFLKREGFSAEAIECYFEEQE